MTPNIYKLSSTPKEGIQSGEHKGFSSQVYREEDGKILGRGVMMLFQSIFGVPPVGMGWRKQDRDWEAIKAGEKKTMRCSV